MNKFSILLLFSIFIFIQCNNDDSEPRYSRISIDTDNDFLVFGSVFGECTGDCRELYMLTSDVLYRDANSDIRVELEFTLFDSSPLTLGQFLDASILQDIPEVIVNSSFDEEDFIDYIADFDYYIYGQRDGVQFSFTYDAIEMTSSNELRTFAENVQDVLEKLGN